MTATAQQTEDGARFWRATLPNRETWLVARQGVLGGSDVAALFTDEDGKSLNPYKNAYELYLEKVGLETQSVEETEAMYWGKHLEPFIATRYQAETQRLIVPLGFTICRTSLCPYLGTTPDCEIPEVDGFEGPGLLSIKNVDLMRFIRQKWDEAELPPYIQIQLQAELAATGHLWGSFALLVGGNRFRWLDVKRNDDFIEVLIERVTEFKARVDAQDPPPVDGSERTTSALKRLYSRENGETIVLGDELRAVAALFERAKKDEKEANERKRLHQNQLLSAIGAAAEAKFSDGSGYTLKTINKAEYSVKAQSYRELRRKAAK